MTASRRQHLLGRSTTAHTPLAWPSAWGDALREGRLTRPPLDATGCSPATQLGSAENRDGLLRQGWTLYSRQMLATGFAAQRYFALDGTDHRSHTEQNTASPPASGAAAPAPSPRSTS
jgi:hypothetical protein